MNLTLMLRYIAELAMIIPAAFLAVIPVTLFQKVNTKYRVFLFSTVLFVSVIGGAALCTVYHLSSNTAILIFYPYFFLNTISAMICHGKKIILFSECFNAVQFLHNVFHICHRTA